MSISRLLQMGAASAAGGPGKYLLDNSALGKLLIYDIRSGSPSYVSTIDDSGVSIGNVQDVKYDPDSAILYILSDNPDRLSSWSVADWASPTKLDDISVGATTNTGNGIALVPVSTGAVTGDAVLGTGNNIVYSVDRNTPSNMVLEDTLSISSPGYGSEGATVYVGNNLEASYSFVYVQEDSVLRQVRVSSINDIASIAVKVDTSRIKNPSPARPLKVDRDNALLVVCNDNLTYTISTWTYSYGTTTLADAVSIGSTRAYDLSLADRKIFLCDDNSLYARNLSTSGAVTVSGNALNDSRFNSTEALAYDADAQIVYTAKYVSSTERNIYQWDVSNTSSMSYIGAYNVYSDAGTSVSSQQFSRIIYEGVANT